MARRDATPSLFGDEPSSSPGPCSHTIQVAFDSGADTLFSYLVPDALWPIQAGQRVEVPFGRGNTLKAAFCVDPQNSNSDMDEDSPKKRSFKLKAVHSVLDEEPLLDARLIELARWISQYYVCPLGQVLAAMVPGAVKRGAGLKKETYCHLLTDAAQALEQLRGPKQQKIISYLLAQRALDSASALSTKRVREQAGCTLQPLKRLTDQGLIQMTMRSTLTALPALPEGLLVPEETNITLNLDQERALAHIKTQLDTEQFGVTLLHGVTGSGKTEVYLRAIKHSLAQGKGAIVLLPEIALTAQTVQRFHQRIGQVAVLHSGLSAAQRHAQWQRIRSSEARVVVGARSAVFAPVQSLGLIVVDEEHESSYKQDSTPRYHGRDLAIKRVHLEGAHCLLGTATPALETLVNCATKEAFHGVRLPKRVKGLPMPPVKLIDLREEPATRGGINLISRALAQQVTRTLERREQAILLLNRRGYSSFVFCPSCKHSLSCRNCAVTLTFHKTRKQRAASIDTVKGKHLGFGHAMCHYCLAQTLVPSKCPLCGKNMTMIGLGSQRLEEELEKTFPEARIARIDSDSMAGKDYYKILKAFGNGDIDILAGTQMLAKGLHFPNVTLVGIISADTSLFLPDFRANERTFQLIAQVAGRAGRSEKQGCVLVQTVMPDQPVIQFAKNGDFDGFVIDELKHRKACNLPPFWRMATITLRDEVFDRLEGAANKLRERIDLTLASMSLNAQVRGPVPPVISRIQRFHRLQIVIQTPGPRTMQQLFASLRAQTPIRPAVMTAIDIDPVNLL
jgi:primosomal protein N' (replication factor Y) (superfamily II helicase)